MPVIAVRGVGNVEFPDSMSDNEIKAALDKQYGKQDEKVQESKSFQMAGFAGPVDVTPETAYAAAGPDAPLAQGIGGGIVSGLGKFATGLGQAVLAAGEQGLFPGMPVKFPQGTEQAFTEAVKPSIESIKERLGDKPGFTGGEFAGQYGPAFMVPTSRSGGFVSRVAQPTVVASGIAGAEYRPEATPEERALARGKEAGTAAMFAGPTAAVLEGAMTGLRKLQPQAATGIRDILKAERSGKLSPTNSRQVAALKEFKTLQRKSNKPIDALLSEVVSSPKVAAFERAVANTSRASDKAFNEVQVLAESSLKNLDDIATRLSKTKKGEVATGRLLKRAVHKAVNSLSVKRSAEAARDYDAVRKIAGNKKFVANDNLVKAFGEIIDEANNTGNRTLARKAAQQMKDMTGKLRSADEMLKFRSSLGDKTRGIGRVISETLDEKESVKYAKKLFRAYSDDIADAEKISEIGPALKAANMRYKQNSKAIEEVRDSVLGKLLDSKGENPLSSFAKKLGTMDSKQVDDTVRMIRDVYPGAERRIGRFIIDDAIKKSRLGGEAVAAAAKSGEDIVSIRKVIKSMPSDEKLVSLFPDKTTRGDVKRILSHMRRLADRPDMGGAGGQPVSAAKDIAGQIASGGKGQSGIFMARFASAPIFTRFYENALFTPEGRKAMLTLIDPKPVNPGVIFSAIKTFEQLEEEDGNQVQQ